jgi:N-acetylglucosaminyldiphosphoundecaprenol N-acetyl-beta-D-mannosaminyltransferase
MEEFKDRIQVPVLLGVGAAFDLNCGRLQQAPLWMRENGLEWLFRLLAEPRRLWRRYLVQGSKFAWCVGLELLGLRRFD